MSIGKMIPISEPTLGEEEANNVKDALQSGWISSKGPYIHEFEMEFAKFIGVKHGISTFNGTTALHLALTSLGIGLRDNVIVPDFTFISPINTILYTGAIPRLVDSNPVHWNMDPNKIEEQIDKKTRAIIVVHLYGYPADLDPILKIAKDYDLSIIEDCAESHGAMYKDKMVGSFGDISCFSFYGNKIITTGEGGMCLTNNQDLADKMEMLRDHGMKPESRYWHNEVGFNYRMTNLQAAIGVAQVNKISRLIENRNKIAKLYNEGLKDIDGIILQPELHWAKSVLWLYSILVENKNKRFSRDSLAEELLKNGIDNRRFFYPAHVMPPYKKFAEGRVFPVSEMLSQTGMNLPSSANLTGEEVTYIAETVRKLIRSNI